MTFLNGQYLRWNQVLCGLITVRTYVLALSWHFGTKRHTSYQTWLLLEHGMSISEDAHLLIGIVSEKEVLSDLVEQLGCLLLLVSHLLLNDILFHFELLVWISFHGQLLAYAEVSCGDSESLLIWDEGVGLN